MYKITIRRNSPVFTVRQTENRIVLQHVTREINITSTGKRGLPGPAGEGVPEGGTTGQFLKKASNDDFDTVWGSGGGGGGGAVDSVNGQTGDVILDADDISDTSTTHKFTTAAQISKLAGIETGAEVNNISDANATDLTDSGDTTLHFHSSDRNRSNHTGTQLAATISNFNTAASAASPVQSVSGKTGTVALDKTDVGLSNVDNTTDANKPISSLTQAALDGKQTLDSDLTTIAGLSPSNDDVIQRKAGAWTNRTPAQLKTDLSLTKSDVGLGNVDNTSDATKNAASVTLTNKTFNAPDNTLTNIATTNIAAATLVTEAEGLAASDNDTSWPTTAAVKDYVDDAVSGGGLGDMTKAVYDPQAINDDAFDRANHTGTQAISTVTGLQTALDGKVDENSAITGATKTKITYDAKGLVTAGADATQDDIGDGTTNKQYSATEKTKLAGIETGADVTDEANVITALDGAVLPTATVATDDKVLIQDTNDNDELKTVTAQAIANLAPGLSDGDKGDITVSSSGATWTIDNDAVSYAKIQDVTATDKILGRVSASAGIIEEITFTDQAQQLADDTSFSAMRTTLGLAIGSDVQAHSSVLDATTASFTTADETKLDGIEALADVTDAGNVGSSIHGSSGKTTPVDADTVPLIDSAASNVLKKVTWANIKATLKTYFDTLYELAGTIATHAALTVTHGATGAIMGTTNTQVVTNKDLTSGTNTFPTFNQSTSGNAATATALQTPRTIGGTSFDGTANIVPSLVTVVDSTDSSSSIAMFDSATGDLQPKTDAGLTYNATTGVLTATGFAGPLTGNVTGNTSGSSGSTTGNAATATALATPRAIYGNNFDGSAALTQVIASTYGGTGNGFAKLSGPTTTEKTFTLPNATATILTDNAAVTVAQGGTGRATGTTAYGIVAVGTTATGTQQTIGPGTSGQILKSNGASALATFQTGAPADVALGNVDNTSDATKNAAAATLTNKAIQYTSSPGSDDTFTGITASMTAAATTAQWEVGYVNSSSQIALGDADAIATSNVMAMATAAISAAASGIYLLHGIARNDAWNWTPGGMLYLSTTAGAITQTAPSGTDDVIQVLGVAITADIIFWNPQLRSVEHT